MAHASAPSVWAGPFPCCGQSIMVEGREGWVERSCLLHELWAAKMKREEAGKERKEKKEAGTRTCPMTHTLPLTPPCFHHLEVVPSLRS